MNVYLYYLALFVELFILIGVSVYGAGLLFSAMKGAPYIPTSAKELGHILGEIKLKKNALFVELGSGDGRLVRYSAQKYGVQGVGIEVNPLLTLLARWHAKREKIDGRVTFVTKNMFRYDFSKAEYIYLFLMPQLIVKLLPLFEKQLHKNTIIISHGFKLPGWEGKLIHTLPAQTFSTFYYRI